MAKTRVVIDQRAIDRYFRTDPVPQAALGEIAGAYKETAEQASPVGRSTWFGRAIRHGWFKGAFHVRRFRGGWRVYNRDAFAHLVEYGSVNNPVYAPMRRALLAMKAGRGRAVVHPSKTSGEHTL